MSNEMNETKPTFIDLFSGVGGFSEGLYREGFQSIVHVDFDEPACTTLKERMKHYNYSLDEIETSVICGDLTHETVNDQIEKVVNGREVDVIVGGPPCQSFSSVGRAQDPNSMRNDPRNFLFLSYLQILDKYKPKIFVFENVSGLLTAKPQGTLIFPEIISLMSKNYKVCTDHDTILLDAVHYGVPQIRKRVILIGVRKDLNFSPEDIYNQIVKTHYSPEEEKNKQIEKREKYLTVIDAIFDLPKLMPGDGVEEMEFKPTILNPYLEKIRTKTFNKLYNHVARKHNSEDRERYRLLSQNNWQLKELELFKPELIHHDPRHFGNRYTVQAYDRPGRTIVAHLYKDGNLFIHPDSTQERTFTVREAARIQSFPDDFKFMGSRTDQYKQVGNAVPPLMANQIAKAIIKFIK